MRTGAGAFLCGGALGQPRPLQSCRQQHSILAVRKSCGWCRRILSEVVRTQKGMRDGGVAACTV